MWSKTPGVGRRVRARRAADRRLVDVDDLVDLVEPVDPVVGAGPQAGPVQAVGDRPVEDLVDQGGLARARDAGHAADDAQRERDVEPFRLCWRAPRTSSSPCGGRRRSLGTGIERSPARYWPVSELARPDDRRGCPRRPPRRRARRRPGPRSTTWSAARIVPRRARPRSPCCRGRAGARACRAASRCRAGAGRSTARRGCRGRRPGSSRSGSRAGCAAPRRRTASRPARSSDR